MARRASSSDSDSRKRSSNSSDIKNIRTDPPHIYDNLTKRLIKLGITLAITTFIGLIVRYAVQEFDPSVSTISVTTSRINDRDIASLSVSKHFLERILEFIEESVAIVAIIIPLGFPLCTIFNKYFAKMRAGLDDIEIVNDKVLNSIPKYVVVGDIQACQMPNSTRLRPLVRDTIYQLIKAHLKPKLIVEDSYEEARRLGIRIGLIRREHHRLAVIKSVDLLKNITDSRGDIKVGKVRYLLSRMKILSQSTPADKSLLVYLIKQCESRPNENLTYMGYSFTDPEAMRIADCAVTFQDCDDEDVKREAQVILKSENMSFTDFYLFIIVCLLSSNITQSYALYQVSASVSCCIYRFLSITVFQEQLIPYSQFTLLVLIQQVFAIVALMTKWLSSLPQTPLRGRVTAEMSHSATEDASLVAAGLTSSSSGTINKISGSGGQHHQQSTMIKMSRMNSSKNRATSDSNLNGNINDNEVNDGDSDSSASSNGLAGQADRRRKSAKPQEHLATSGRHSVAGIRHRGNHHSNSNQQQHIHLSGIDFDQAIINSKLVTTYKQTFESTSLLDDVTYRLIKLQIAYQVLVMVIIMIFGNTMFQINKSSSRQHQTLALNSLIMNNIFNLSNCFNQFGEINLKSGFRSHPFFVCVSLLAVFLQVCLTELNAFGLENLDPIQWFVCFVFALLSALIAPLTGQQQRYRRKQDQQQPHQHHPMNFHDGQEAGLAQKLAKHQRMQQQQSTGGSRSPGPVVTTTPTSLPRARSSLARHHPSHQTSHKSLQSLTDE